MDLLLSARCDIDAKDYVERERRHSLDVPFNYCACLLQFGRTPLFYAFRERHTECAMELMKNRACPWSDFKNNIHKYANDPDNPSRLALAFRITKKVNSVGRAAREKEDSTPRFFFLARHISYSLSALSRRGKRFTMSYSLL